MKIVPPSRDLSMMMVLLVASASALSASLLKATRDTTRTDYVGDATCMSCHKGQSSTYIRTAHHLTSRLPTNQSVLGSFREGENVLTIVDPINATHEPALYFQMEKRGEDFFETGVTGFAQALHRRTEPIQIVLGSGTRGQSYLTWQDDRLFELPVSFWTDGKRWINSPGYVDGSANFSRPINPGCIECHASYLAPLSPDPTTNRFRRDSFVPGISCETCHGPGATHVARHNPQRASSSSLPDEAIVNPAKLTRDLQVDLCAVCHNGIDRKPLAPAYSFAPGKPLREYFEPMSSTTAAHPDVHGNQVGLLQRSRCYVASPLMTCSTCHNTHAPERSAAAYSDRCLTCHRWQSCGVSRTLGKAIASNCIDCHMPVEATAVIVSQTAGTEVRATMRNHWIKVYSNARQDQGEGINPAVGKPVSTSNWTKTH